MSMRLMMTICLIALAGGCANLGGSYCAIAVPIKWSCEAELLATPRPITRQIVTHNETIRAVCGILPEPSNEDCADE